MSAGPDNDPFSSAGLLRLPALELDDSSQWHGFNFDNVLESKTFRLPTVVDGSLPSLESTTFKFVSDNVSLPDLEGSTSSSLTTAEDGPTHDKEELVTSNEVEGNLENLWNLPDVKERQKDIKLNSWDRFLDSQHCEPQTTYLSEASAATFDALLDKFSTKTCQVRYADTDQFLNALVDLGLGRTSSYFTWDETQQQFSSQPENVTISGFDPETVQNVVHMIAALGTDIRKLSSHRTSNSDFSANFTPGRIAFNAAIRTCVSALHEHVETQRFEAISLLKIESVFRRPRALAGLLKQLTFTVEREKNDRVALQRLLQTVQNISMETPEFEPFVRSLISTVAAPTLRALLQGIGLLGDESSFGSQTAEQLSLEDGQSWHGILEPGMVSLVDEIRSSRKLLQRNDLKQVSLFLSSVNLGGCLQLQHSWEAISHSEKAASDYEHEVMNAITKSNHAKTTNLPLSEHSTTSQCPTTMSEWKLDSFNSDGLLSDLLHHKTTLASLNDHGDLHSIVLSCFRNTHDSAMPFLVPCDQALSLSISPYISAQHRLLSYSMMDLLFQQHNLLAHLEMQRNIQLLDAATFSSQLGISLFDSNQSPGEGKRRAGTTTGLRLQARETWPPASSEIRLVLMGILSESLKGRADRAVEDSISFAIRDLSDEELEKCRDADSIYALDFLRVQYRPPNTVLEAVITNEILEKYDRAFQFLLRLLRVQSVVQSLIREVCPRSEHRNTDPYHRFRCELRQFVSSLADYCHNVAIAVPWSKFSKTLRNIEEGLKQHDYAGTLKNGKSLENLRRIHESTLDSILRGLLLKRKQQPVMSILEEIFGIVLRFAAFLRRNQNDDDDFTIRRFYEEFRTLVRKLTSLLQLAANDFAIHQGMSQFDDETNFSECLLVRLDMTGYWV